MVFSKTTACSSYVQPWLVAIGGWRLVEIAGWRLAAVGGGWRQLAVGDGWLVAVDSGWRLAVAGGWRLAVGGPLGRSLRAVLNKKKIWSLKDRPGTHPLTRPSPRGWASDTLSNSLVGREEIPLNTAGQGLRPRCGCPKPL